MSTRVFQAHEPDQANRVRCSVSMSATNDPTADAERSDAWLVSRAREGQASAFETLVERYQRRACSVAYRLLGNTHDALEVCQEAFIRAYRNLDSLKNRSRFGAWLLRIVTNLALNFRRDRAAVARRISVEDLLVDGRNERPMHVEDRATAAPDAQLAAGETAQLVQEAIAELPDHLRTALVLYCIEQLPQREVAGIMECSVEAVKWYVFQARRKLRQRLDDLL